MDNDDNFQQHGGGIGIWIGIIVLVVILALTALVGYFIWKEYEKYKKCKADPPSCIPNVLKPHPLKCPPGTQADLIGTLCYQNCPAGYTWDGAQMCHQDCPSNWQGGSSLAYCTHKTIYSTVGTTGLDKVCAPGLTNFEGLCYKLPSAAWEVTSPGFIGLKCDPNVNDSGTTCWYDRGVGVIPNKKSCATWNSHWRDDGTSCWEDAKTVGRGVGYPWQIGDTPFSLSQATARCEQAYGRGNCEKYDVVIYPKCGVILPGSNATGCCTCEGGCGCIKKTLADREYCPAGEVLIDHLCYKNPEPGYTCAVTNCSKSKDVTSQIGTVPDECPSGKELGPGISKLCYPICPKGFLRQPYNLEYCTEPCPAGFTDIGIGGCTKPTTTLPVAKSIIAVGICPAGQHRTLDLCYDNQKN